MSRLLVAPLVVGCFCSMTCVAFSAEVRTSLALQVAVVGNLRLRQHSVVHSEGSASTTLAVAEEACPAFEPAWPGGAGPPTAASDASIDACTSSVSGGQHCLQHGTTCGAGAIARSPVEVALLPPRPPVCVDLRASSALNGTLLSSWTCGTPLLQLSEQAASDTWHMHHKSDARLLAAQLASPQPFVLELVLADTPLQPPP
mmetsp:Transcript_52919/g.123873  ORF Transcript_52919/g.123873 Transcript_52919/m.123873 type:complete len:201 (-) Transcript_52919:1404-2006(-)